MDFKYKQSKGEAHLVPNVSGSTPLGLSPLTSAVARRRFPVWVESDGRYHRC